MHSTAIYVIRIAEALDEVTANWFEELTIRQMSDAATILITPPIDQTALHGILATLRDLAIPLIAVCPLNTMAGGCDAARDASDVSPQAGAQPCPGDLGVQGERALPSCS